MKKNLGIALICIAAFLYGIRYLAAAIYGSNTQTWSRELFKSMLDYVGFELLALSLISLFSGILIIVLPELKNRIKSEIEQVKEGWNRDMR